MSLGFGEGRVRLARASRAEGPPLPIVSDAACGLVR